MDYCLQIKAFNNQLIINQFVDSCLYSLLVGITEGVPLGLSVVIVNP